jgi:hypothetical protein
MARAASAVATASHA